MRFRRVLDPGPVRLAPAPPAKANGVPVLPAPVLAYVPPLFADLGMPAPEDGQRGDDLSLLRALVAHLEPEVEAHAPEDETIPETLEEVARLSEEAEHRDRDVDELEAFSGMLADLVAGRREMLTKKQREWAVAAAERREVEWGDPAARNRAVPRGREVALLVDRMARPLTPPGRR